MKTLEDRIAAIESRNQLLAHHHRLGHGIPILGYVASRESSDSRFLV